MNRFYVYSHVRKDTGKCFYIGKGTGYRYKSKSGRNCYWKNIINKCGYDCIILVNNISEQKAFELESLFCKSIGYNNLVNIREELGWGGYSHSEETKQKQSKSHKNKKKPWVSTFKTGKKDSPETIIKKSKPKSQKHKDNISKGLKGVTKGREITWKDKISKAKKGKSNGQDFSKRKIDYKNINVGSKGKKVFQYDLEGNFIKEWVTKKKASTELGYNMVMIGLVCLEQQKSYKGYIWKYANK